MNNYLYNQGTELNTSTGYYETPHRLCDAALGWFMGVDAMASIYPHQSPYHYANNNPVMYNDPTGLYGNNSDWGISFNGANYNHPSADWYDMGYGSFYDYAVDYQAYYQWMSQSYYGHQVSNNPDAYNIMRNALMGVPNAIATGISSSVPVNAWSMGHWEDRSYVDYTSENLNGETWTGATVVKQSEWVLDRNPVNGGMADFSSNLDHALTIGGATFSGLQNTAANQRQWLGKNGKHYSNNWGGNQHTGSRAGAFKAANTYRWAGRATVFVSVGTGVYSTIEGFQADGGEFGYNAQKAAASSAGGIAGGIIGAKIGAGIGVWFGGVGAIPGAAIGAFVGGIIGGYGGSYLGEKGVDYLYGK